MAKTTHKYLSEMNPADPVAPSTHRTNWQSDSALTVVCYLIVLAVGWCCFGVHREEPAHLFWDENYHVTSAERYIEGVAFFETHPPLAKMLIALGEKLYGSNRQIDKHILTIDKKINGDDLPKGFSFAGMRLMPAVFATLGGLAFFGLMRELFTNRLHALLLSGLYLFENAFSVHFRAVHLDSFQICFAITLLWQFVHFWKRTDVLRPWYYALLAVWAGLAVMVKVNGVVLMAVFPMLYFHDAVRHTSRSIKYWLIDFSSKAGAAIAAFCLVIYAVFWVHALLTPNMPEPNTPAGQTDIANMSPAYRTHLEQHQTLSPRIVITLIHDYYKFMEKDNKGVPKLDINKPGENGSHPLHWPFHDRNINYRWDSADGKTAYVQLVGNQLAWYSGTAAVFFCLLLVSNHRLLGMRPPCSMNTYSLIEAFTSLYVAFMAMNLWLISQRVMYLYHYFIGLLISYVLLALVWRYCSEVSPRFARSKTPVLAGVMATYLASYLFFLPLSNHWPLTKEQCERRNIWISHILDCH